MDVTLALQGVRNAEPFLEFFGRLEIPEPFLVFFGPGITNSEPFLVLFGGSDILNPL